MEPLEEKTRDYVVPFRIAGSRGETPLSKDSVEDTQGVGHVADLMLGAAHSDGKYCGREEKTVRGLLLQLLQRDRLPDALEAKLATFDPKRFDLVDSVSAFSENSATTNRRLIELVRLVCDADAMVALSEDNYLIALALALSMAPSEYHDLVVRESAGVNGGMKRVADIVLASAVLVLTAPLMLGIAIAIKLTSPGPVFFRQKRYGRAAEIIGVLKFRSMRTTGDGAAVTQATVGDPRITQLGMFLRRTSLDELPQLFNVLMGTMSLVGPRPHAIAHNHLYQVKIIEYMLRHKVKPGMTGWAQVNGWRGETDTLRKMVYRIEYDLEYIRNWSLWMDLKILWLTVFGRKVWENAR
jgi:putative colanic acid biosynthesis UDP-glucose lipid carrier transferase